MTEGAAELHATSFWSFKADIRMRTESALPLRVRFTYVIMAAMWRHGRGRESI